jgi:ABC-type transporter Mla maintaining outer membrane lipid asymmetry ATPase subunit MlaF
MLFMRFRLRFAQGLDPVVSTQMEDLVRKLQQVCPTCVVVTHQYSTVRRAVDRVVFLHKGKVQWDGAVSQLDTTDNAYIRQFFDASLIGPIEALSLNEEVPKEDRNDEVYDVRDLGNP